LKASSIRANREFILHSYENGGSSSAPFIAKRLDEVAAQLDAFPERDVRRTIMHSAGHHQCPLRR
jgi:hypothetical protein